MFKKENKENNINIQDLKEILDESVDKTIAKIESHISEEKDDLSLMIFSLQNRMAIMEYKREIEQKLGLRKEK